MFIQFSRAILTVLVLVGCGADHSGGELDAKPASLDCPSYCEAVQTSCTGAEAQYSDMAHCLATCASFTVGTSQVTDPEGNTLGCRIFHAGAAAMAAPEGHCAHAGPAGDQLMASPPAACSGGDVCTSFCTLQIKACGSLDAPLPGDPRNESGNSLFQYRNMADCMRLCVTFDKTHRYNTTAAGDSLACRLLHATSAAIAVTPNATTECIYTRPLPTGPCAGAPSP